MKIYKYYGPCEYAFESFEKEQVCFNAMRNFRDKMEGTYKMIPNAEAVSESADDEHLRRVSNRIPKAIADRFSGVNTELIRFRCRILSTTDSMQYRYMWKEYAENATGFCLEYDSEDLAKVSYRYGYVRYAEDKEPDGIFGGLADGEDLDSKAEEFWVQAMNILFTKILHQGDDNHREQYDKEREIRFMKILFTDEFQEVSIDEYMAKHLCEDADKYDTYFADFCTGKHYKAPNLYFEKVKPKRVFVGSRMSEVNRDRIEKKANELGIDVITVKDEELKG